MNATAQSTPLEDPKTEKRGPGRPKKEDAVQVQNPNPKPIRRTSSRIRYNTYVKRDHLGSNRRYLKCDEGLLDLDHYEHRWLADVKDGERIKQMQDEGWQLAEVEGMDEVGEGEKAVSQEGSRVKAYGGIDEGGKKYDMYLAFMPKEIYAEKQLRKDAELDRVTLKRFDGFDGPEQYNPKSTKRQLDERYKPLQGARQTYENEVDENG